MIKMDKLYAKTIYTKSAIKCAVNDYKNVCRIIVAEINDSYLLSFSKCVYDETLTINEFDNYLILAMSKEVSNDYI